MNSGLAAAWRLNQAMNRKLLDAVSRDGLMARYAPTTRTVASQFAHMHNVRVSHLERRRPEVLGGLTGFPRGAQPSRKELRTALAASAAAVGEMFAQGDETGRIDGWPGAPATYLGYFVSHESHHRGLVLVALRVAGIKLPKAVTYGLWAWK